MKGFIKVHRELLSDGLLQKPVLLQVWMFLSCAAWFRKTVIDGIEILPGQALVTAGEIACACNLQEHKVRYALNCLEKQGLIRRENIRNRYSLITVLDRAEEALPKEEKTTQEDTAATEKHDTCVQAKPESKRSYGLFCNVYLTDEEKRKLRELSHVADSYIENLSAYKRRTQKEYDDDFSVLCEWISKDKINQNSRTAKQEDLRQPRAGQPVPDTRTAPQIYAEYDFATSPASYDLALAEKRALESVPTLTKRRRQ